MANPYDQFDTAPDAAATQPAAQPVQNAASAAPNTSSGDFPIGPNGIPRVVISAPSTQSAQAANPYDQFDAPPIGALTRAVAAVPASSSNNDGRDTVLGKIDSGVRGAADALTLGYADKIAAGLGAATGLGGTFGDYSGNLARERATDASDAANRPVEHIGGEVAGSLVGGAGLARQGLSLGANAARAGLGLGTTTLASVGDGAILGGIQGAASTDDGNTLYNAGKGALVGGIVGGIAPGIVSGLTSSARRLVTPFTIPAERQAAVDYLRQEGVPLTAGQATGSKALRFAESELGGTDVPQNQGVAFTDAAMRRAGGTGLATPDNLAELRGRLGQQFEDIAGRNTLVPDQQFAQDVGNTLKRYSGLLESQQKPIVANVVDDLVKRIGASNGTLSGQEYQAIRSDLSTAANSTGNVTLSKAFGGIRDALDSAMDRSINPQDSGKWGDLRRQYGNLKVLQNASTGAGEDAGIGIISPARLRMAASAGNRERFATGKSDFTDLAKAGQAVMTPMPNSGTASRSWVRHIGPAVLGSLGAAAGGAHDATAILPGVALGVAGPAVVGKALMSRPVQSYLTNQALRGAASPESRALGSYLLTNGAVGLGSRWNHP